MKKLAMVCGPALGHVSRLSSVCNSLYLGRDDLDIDFIYPGKSLFPGLLLPAQVRRTSIPVSGDNFFERSVAFAKGIDGVFNRNDFDVVVQDGSPLHLFSAVNFPECPRVNVTNAFLTALGNQPTVQDLLFENYKHKINSYRSCENGLEEIGSARELYEADKVLLADPAPISDSLTRHLPDNYVQCGACYDTADRQPIGLPSFADSLILSMGSTGRGTIKDSDLSSLAEFTNSREIVYVGSNGSDYENSHVINRVYEWLPLSPLLRHCSAVVTSGGAGSSYQALAAGCPTLVVPSHQNHVILGKIRSN